MPARLRGGETLSRMAVLKSYSPSWLLGLHQEARNVSKVTVMAHGRRILPAVE